METNKTCGVMGSVNACVIVSQRFFFPWPQMPHQQFDAHMDRVAGQRRCEEDDQAFVSVCQLTGELIPLNGLM